LKVLIIAMYKLL